MNPARMNYLHSLYQRSGKISNDDMLYTLSLFILEVERWIRLYEWRKLTDMELCALYVFDSYYHPPFQGPEH